MFIFGYLRASANDQDALRAQERLKSFVQENGHRVAGWYIENASGASLQRPELMRLLNDAEPGDLILVEQVDRLSRLDDAGWQRLKRIIEEKRLAVISLDLPTSHVALTRQGADEFTRSMLSAINSMMLDMLAAIARKDYSDRRRRQQEGITKAKQQGVYRGRSPNLQKHELILALREQGKSIRETARLAGVSERTVTRISKASSAD
ncbi:serine recombinase [Salmonella enterica subsp. enterica serovar Telelkebir]|nr:serine recombinase [Salmonella enterica subsp. enterica serovar Telelkebir]ELT8232560.1 recombinase family protein [Salmonella enterica]